MRPIATATLLVGACMGLVACSTVIVEQDDELAASSGGPGSGTAPSTSAVGGSSGSEPAGSGAGGATGASGSGGAPSTGAGGALPGSCSSLVWSEPTRSATEVRSADHVMLADMAEAGPQALYVGRTTSGLRKRITHLRAIDGAWDGPIAFRNECAPREFWCHTADESDAGWSPAAPGPGTMHVVWECGAGDERMVEAVQLIAVGGGSAHKDASEELLDVEPIRDMALVPGGSGAVSPIGTYTTAFVGGRERLQITSYVNEEDVWYQPVAVDACADREVPADVVAHEGRFALAYGTTASGTCDDQPAGPPTLARLGFFDAGGAVVDVATLDLGAPVVELHAVATAAGLHVVARTDGSDGPALSILRRGATGELELIARTQVASDRRIAVAAMGERLGLIDVGSEAPRLRARVFDVDGSLEAISSAPEDLVPLGPVGALGSSGALLVGFMDEGEEGLRHGLIRVECRETE